MMETQATWESGGDLLSGIQPGCEDFGHKFQGRFAGSADWGGEVQSRDCQRPNCNITETRWKP